MNKLMFAFVILAVMTGCMRVITIEKHDPIPITGTNGVEYIDGGYDVYYRNIGLKTDVSSISAEKTENGVKVKISGVATDVSAEHKEIIASGGTAVGNVAEKVVEGVKGVETIKRQ